MISLLILKDVAARGLDLPQVTWIVQVGLLCVSVCVECSLAQMKSLLSPEPSCSLLVLVLMPVGVGDIQIPDCRTGTLAFARIKHFYNSLGLFFITLVLPKFLLAGDETSSISLPRKPNFVKSWPCLAVLLLFS